MRLLVSPFYKNKIKLWMLLLAEASVSLLEKLHTSLTLKYPKLAPKANLLRVRCRDDRLRFLNSAWLEADGIFPLNKNTYHHRDNLSAIVTMEYHRLEKGMVLPNRRVGAGQDAIIRLLLAIELQYKFIGATAEGAIGLRTISIYLSETPTEALSTDLLDKLALFKWLHNEYLINNMTSSAGGYKTLAKKELVSSLDFDFEAFALSRHSIRDYADKQIDIQLLKEIVTIAMSTPSVCNRQAWRVYIVTDRVTIESALLFQNGNRGFTDRVPALFIVCADLHRFVSVEERNQAWIDGGLFSMTLMLTIHGKNLGSCPLNWSASRENDQGLRRLFNIPQNEVVIMMLSLGYLQDVVKFTDSPRRSINEVISVVS
jgi:nitroreductase